MYEVWKDVELEGIRKNIIKYSPILILPFCLINVSLSVRLLCELGVIIFLFVIVRDRVNIIQSFGATSDQNQGLIEAECRKSKITTLQNKLFGETISINQTFGYRKRLAQTKPVGVERQIDLSFNSHQGEGMDYQMNQNSYLNEGSPPINRDSKFKGIDERIKEIKGSSPNRHNNSTYREHSRNNVVGFSVKLENILEESLVSSEVHDVRTDKSFVDDIYSDARDILDFEGGQHNNKNQESIHETFAPLTLVEFSRIMGLNERELLSHLNFDISKIDELDSKKAKINPKQEVKISSPQNQLDSSKLDFEGPSLSGLSRTSSVSIGLADKDTSKLKSSMLFSNPTDEYGTTKKKFSFKENPETPMPVDMFSGVQTSQSLGNKSSDSRPKLSPKLSENKNRLFPISEEPGIDSPHAIKANGNEGLRSFGMMMDEEEVEDLMKNQDSPPKLNVSNFGATSELITHDNLSKRFTELKEEIAPSAKSIPQDVQDDIKAALNAFFGTICQELDGHFLKTIDMLLEAFARMEKKGKTIYLEFIRSFIVRFIIDNYSTYNQNKVKCVYMALVMRILTAKIPYLLETFVSVVVRKFPFFESFEPIKDALKDGMYSYYTTFGFDSIPSVEKSDKDQVIKAFMEEKNVSTFFTRLEAYSTLYFGILSVDLEQQLKHSFPEFLNKHNLWSGKCPDISYKYFSVLSIILTQCPDHIQPLLIKQWLIVGSDMWHNDYQKMMSIVRLLNDRVLKKFEAIFNSNKRMVHFEGEHANNEMKANYISLKKELEEILSKQKIADKYDKLDIMYR